MVDQASSLASAISFPCQGQRSPAIQSETLSYERPKPYAQKTQTRDTFLEERVLRPQPNHIRAAEALVQEVVVLSSRGIDIDNLIAYNIIDIYIYTHTHFVVFCMSTHIHAYITACMHGFRPKITQATAQETEAMQIAGRINQAPCFDIMGAACTSGTSVRPSRTF